MCEIRHRKARSLFCARFNLAQRFFCAAIACCICASVIGCRTAPAPVVNLTEPGWTVREGQAIWKRGRDAPEIAGEILLATRENGRAYVQFSKNPFPLVIAQSVGNTWHVQTPTDNKHYSGHGKPPRRLIFLYLARALNGEELGTNWSWQKLENNGWRLENRSSGESVEVYFTQ